MSRIKKRILLNPLINMDGSITARPCTKTDLAMVYYVSTKTMSKWIKPFVSEVQKMTSHLYNQQQVDTIFKHLGTPTYFDFEKAEQLANAE